MKKTCRASTKNQSEGKNTWAGVKGNKATPTRILMKMIGEQCFHEQAADSETEGEHCARQSGTATHALEPTGSLK